MALILKSTIFYFLTLSLASVYVSRQFDSIEVLNSGHLIKTVNTIQSIKKSFSDSKPTPEKEIVDEIQFEHAAIEKNIRVVEAATNEDIFGEFQISSYGKSEETHFTATLNVEKFLSGELVKIKKWGHTPVNLFWGKKEKIVPIFENKELDIEENTEVETGAVLVFVDDKTNDVDLKSNYKKKKYLNEKFVEIDPELEEFKFVMFLGVSPGLKELKIKKKNELKSIIPLFANELTFIDSGEIDSQLNIGSMAITQQAECLTNDVKCSNGPLSLADQCRVTIQTDGNEVRLYEAKSYRPKGKIQLKKNSIEYQSNAHEFLIIKTVDKTYSAVCAPGISFEVQI